MSKMEFQRYNLSEADLNEDLKKSKNNLTLMHRALIRLTMILKKVTSWSKPRSLFCKIQLGQSPRKCADKKTWFIILNLTHTIRAV